MKNEKKHVPSVGLDVGTSRIVSARSVDETFVYATQLNAFVELPWSKLAVKTLAKEGVPHSEESGRIVVQGWESARFADLLGIEMRRSMSRGVLNPNEPESLPQIRRIIEHLVGPSDVKGQRLCFSVPAAIPGSEENSTYHEASLRQILTDLGYSPRPINEGLAVVYAELEASNYTGIGISFGGGLCNVCLAYLSVPISVSSMSKAGDYIDTSAAAATGDLTNRIRLRKEDNFYFNGSCSDKHQQALTIYYDDVITGLIEHMKEQFASCRRAGQFKTPVPLVLSGGSVLPKGFRDRFEAALQAGSFPIPVSEVRLAANPLETTAKGALVSALSEAD